MWQRRREQEYGADRNLSTLCNTFHGGKTNIVPPNLAGLAAWNGGRLRRTIFYAIKRGLSLDRLPLICNRTFPVFSPEAEILKESLHLGESGSEVT